MGRVKDFRLFMAEDIERKYKGLIDIDKAFVIADDLWDRAMQGRDKRAANRLNYYVTKYRALN